ncbi:MAG: hypothetical protein ACRDP7_14245 [Trebonia sp.]
MPDFAMPTAPTRVAELIPGEHYVVLTDGGGAFPDEDVIEELRILAYAKRDKETLGPDVAQTVASLSEAVAVGVASDMLWAECQEAKRFVDKLRSGRKKRLRKPEDAARQGLEAIKSPQIPVIVDAAVTEISVSGTGADGSTWKGSCKASGKLIEFQVDVDGTVIDVIIRAS